MQVEMASTKFWYDLSSFRFGMKFCGVIVGFGFCRWPSSGALGKPSDPRAHVCVG